MSRSEPLHILQIVPYYKPAWAYGGSTRIAYELSTRLAARGHAVTVLTTDALDALHRAPAGEHIVDGVTVRRFRNLSNHLAWKRIFIPPGFRAGCARVVPAVNVAHLHEARSLLNTLAFPALLRHNVPYIVMPHGGLPVTLGRTAIKRVYDRFSGCRLMEHAARLHALTTTERQQYTELGLPASRIVLIPNGIDVTSFDLDADVAAFRRQVDIPADAPVIGFLGRLNAIKGVDFLIEAFVEVLAAHPDAILVLAGPDDGARADLEAQVKRAGIQPSVRFTGMIADDAVKAAVYRTSAVHVLPSRYDILPTTVLEALLNSTPSIITDRCGLAVRLVDADVVRAVPFGSVPALAAAIRSVLDNPEPARAQARRGREYVIAHFNWDAVTDGWLEVYYGCIAERQKPAGPMAS